VERLREIKRTHEERILRLTGFDPANKTTIVRLRANFDSQVADPIARGAIEQAIAPKFMQDEQGLEVDLTQVPFRFSPEFWTIAADQVRSRVAANLAPGVAREAVRHVSVFAMAPIPLLMVLGHAIGSLVPVDLYQRHMDTDSWCWKDETEPTEFTVTAERDGSPGEVVVLISVSGKIDRQKLPVELSGLPLYELTVANGVPARNRINTRADLERFRNVYQGLLGAIRRDHPDAEVIHLFPAAPAPVAVTCGREVLRKVDPVIHVYDFDKVAMRYAYTLKVNEK
jgi:hypothetical protein